MKNKGFTLIELIAVIVILGLLLIIAVPNLLASIERNKRKNFLHDAERFIALAESTIQSNKEIKLPKKGELVLVNLNYMTAQDFGVSTYGPPYNLKHSFVFIYYKEPKGNSLPYGVAAYLIACGSTKDGSKVTCPPSSNTGNVLTVGVTKEELSQSNAYSMIKTGGNHILSIITEEKVDGKNHIKVSDNALRNELYNMSPELKKKLNIEDKKTISEIDQIVKEKYVK